MEEQPKQEVKLVRIRAYARIWLVLSVLFFVRVCIALRRERQGARPEQRHSFFKIAIDLLSRGSLALGRDSYLFARLGKIIQQDNDCCDIRPKELSSRLRLTGGRFRAK